MRVALFFDGKNFYSGWRERGEGHNIEFVRMAQWLMARVGGSVLWGAMYYTGVEPDTAPGTGNRLESFLEMLELQPGYFVQRFPRRLRTRACEACGVELHYTEEKEVDTTMVSDMLRLAAVGAFDIMVLLSGDSDLAPAVEGVRMLGKQAYVATWGGVGLSLRLRRAAFDHIDLTEGLSEFEYDGAASGSLTPQAATSAAGEVPTSAGEPHERDDSASHEQFLAELARAELQFATGYVGVNYFVTSWRSEKLDSNPALRRRLLSELVELGKVALYDTPEGEKAMRRL